MSTCNACTVCVYVCLERVVAPIPLITSPVETWANRSHWAYLKMLCWSVFVVSVSFVCLSGECGYLHLARVDCDVGRGMHNFLGCTYFKQAQLIYL
jgi:hypothetical protein